MSPWKWPRLVMERTSQFVWNVWMRRLLQFANMVGLVLGIFLLPYFILRELVRLVRLDADRLAIWVILAVLAMLTFVSVVE